MKSISIKLKTECKHCGSPMLLNALVNNFICSSCNKTNSFDYDLWKSFLNKRGTSKIISGEYTYNVTCERRKPHCVKCNENINVEKLDEYNNKKNIFCPKCSHNFFVRKCTAELEQYFPNLTYLVGEDENLLSTYNSKEDLPYGNKPIIFNCPSCAGSLKVDGKNRIVECTYCDSNVYLPDDLWQRLHPVKVIRSWFLVYDNAKVNTMIHEEGAKIYEVKPEINSDEIIVSVWLKEEGDEVDKDEVIAELETDKASMELRAEVKGTISEIFVKEGESANKETVFCTILYF